MSAIVYGNQGCGKTTHQAALAKHLGLSQIIDEWNGIDPLPDNTLALTNVEGIEGALDFFDVMEEMGFVIN